MLQRICALFTVGMLVLPLFSQGIRDSVFSIDAVEITTGRIFVKEQAGMKRTEVDTALLSEKTGLLLSDLLSENTTIFIKNDGRGALATASFRGTAASHTRVNWNGIPINNPMTGMVDFSQVPVYLIDELELKHGAASIADQGGGIGGSVNLGNSADWNAGKVFRYIQGVGSYSTFDEFLQAGFGNDRIRSKTRIYHNHSENDYTFINRGIGNLDPVTGLVVYPLDTNDHAAYTRYGVLQEIYIRPGANHMVSLHYWGQYADRTIPRPTSYEGTDYSNLNGQQDADHRVVAQWKHYGNYGNIILRSGYSVNQMLYAQKNRVPGIGLVPSVYSESRQQSLVNTLSYSFDFRRDFSMEAKVEANHHDVNSQDSVLRAGYKQQRNEWSIYMAFRKSFKDRLNLNLMLRQGWSNGERIPIIPFLGADIRLIDGIDLVWKANIARNYHLPTLNDLYWQPGGNPDLLPEEGYSAETGLEYRQDLSRLQLQTGFTAYRSDIHNWIIWTPSFRGYWEPFNIRKVIASGVEYDLKVSGNLGKLQYRLALNYAYTSSVNNGDSLVWGDASPGKQMVYIPLHSGNLFVRLSTRNLFISYQYNAYSERFTTSSNDLTRRDWLYPYFMSDVTLGGELRIRKTGFSAELKIFNLFNETYHSVLYRPMPGRNYQLVLKFKF
jgi:outer membrane cobalamin receptor